MERKVNKKIESYLTSFKDAIRDKTTELNIIDSEHLLQFIYNYERLVIEKEDLANRKRLKNIVPHYDRCCSRRANNEQCTRRKKEGCSYCGTHMKGTPHGIIDSMDKDSSKIKTTKTELWAQDIQGIIYYLDKSNNVYSAEDIVSNNPTPKIFAKYIKKGENYEIVDNSFTDC